jgi:hypothetical protein
MSSLRAVALLACLTLGTRSALGQPSAAGDPANEAAAEPRTLRGLIDASVKWYDVYPSLEASEPAQPLVALRWANNTRGSEDGVTILWVAAGRPIAAACVYPWDGRLEHDFESLSRGPIVAKRGEAVVWQPAKGGIAFAPIPSAPAPEEKPAARLRQMKELAGRFRGTLLGWKVDNSDREELRLLTRPLYRYEVQAGPIIDGAVFALAMGTDPEILLLIEAVQEGDKTSWQYAFARRTSGQLEARLGKSVVWEAERFPTQRDSGLPHFTLATPLPPAIAAEERTLEASAR